LIELESQPSVDKRTPTREEIQKLLSLVLELLSQDIATDAGALPSSSTENIDDIELEPSDESATSAGQYLDSPANRPDEG
jgi:hypothetical protein